MPLVALSVSNIAFSGRVEGYNTVTFGAVETTSVDSYTMAMEERYVYIQ